MLPYLFWWYEQCIQYFFFHLFVFFSMFCTIGIYHLADIVLFQCIVQSYHIWMVFWKGVHVYLIKSTFFLWYFRFGAVDYSESVKGITILSLNGFAGFYNVVIYISYTFVISFGYDLCQQSLPFHKT